LNIGILGLGTDSASIRHTFVKSTGFSSNAPPTVEIDAAPTLDLGQAGADSGKNSITRGTGGKAVLNYSGTPVYARRNYWATPTPDSATLFGGAVLFTPYLPTEPPPPAAPRIAVEEGSEETLPKKYSLGQNYPNPFNPATTISFSLAQSEKVKLKIYNLLGQEVLTLLNGEKPAGTHQIVWDGRDENGITVASGIYFYKLEAAGFKEVKRMVFLK
jgi:hypothetical protein